MHWSKLLLVSKLVKHLSVSPVFVLFFSCFFPSSLSISTFQAFQLSTLHQRPDSVLLRLTKAHNATTSRHGT